MLHRTQMYLLACSRTGFKRVSVPWLRRQRHGKTRITALTITGRRCQLWLIDLPKARKWTMVVGIRTDWNTPKYKVALVPDVGSYAPCVEDGSQSEKLLPSRQGN
jgi:hypothetical protein